MNNEKKIKLMAAAATALFFISLIVIGFTAQKNVSLKKVVDHEKLKAETLLSEKLKLDKQILDFKNELNSLSGKNKELNQFVNDYRAKLSDKEEHINRLYKENTSMKNLKKENEELRKMREQMTEDIQRGNAENVKLTAQIENMNRSIINLQNQNQELERQLSDINANTAANLKIEVVKRDHEKLTVKAKRTHTLFISFDLPKTDQKRNFRVDLQSPKGSDIAGDLQTEVVSSTTELSASINVGQVASKERISLSFTPEDKLQQGVHTLFIFDGHKFISSVQFRLNK